MKVACIIPAYNEEKTIGEVVKVVKDISLINQVIVVSDGSTDNTSKISKELGAETLELKKNQGKGAAIRAGVMSTNSDICLFLDGDLVGLTVEHVNKLLMPILNDQADMSIGIFSKGRFATDLAQKIAPNLSGQRVIRREILNNCDDLEVMRYGVEIALNKLAKRKKLKVVNVELEDMTHIMKEEKLGFIKGFSARIKMYWDIIKCIKM